MASKRDEEEFRKAGAYFVRTYCPNTERVATRWFDADGNTLKDVEESPSYLDNLDSDNVIQGARRPPSFRDHLRSGAIAAAKNKPPPRPASQTDPTRFLFTDDVLIIGPYGEMRPPTPEERQKLGLTDPNEAE